MALTYSDVLPLGEKAKPFTLKDVNGVMHSLDAGANDSCTIVMFICNHCPYVHAVEKRIAELAHDYAPKGVRFLAVCSNDIKDYPEDSIEGLKKQIARTGFNFPYLIDETQKVAREYGAVCTPDFFIFNNDMRLSYHGRIDDSWKDASKVTKKEMRAAIDLILKGMKPEEKQFPSMGCSIKWF